MPLLPVFPKNNAVNDPQLSHISNLWPPPDSKPQIRYVQLMCEYDYNMFLLTTRPSCASFVIQLPVLLTCQITTPTGQIFIQLWLLYDLLHFVSQANSMTSESRHHKLRFPTFRICCPTWYSTYLGISEKAGAAYKLNDNAPNPMQYSNLGFNLLI